ncbi:hypothetical protein ACFWEJ_26380, partial [Promicromonospora sp. NPDC060204]|uniref:hypothetical protein n=1 Tax=Promicromonospora sp. NPDC060204 TaxID=3347071 RepID=UPI003660914F
VVSVVAACTGPDHRAQDFAATFTDSDGGVLALHDDGGFELSGIPVDVLDNDDGPDNTDEPRLTGTWDLTGPETDAIMLLIEEGGDALPYANVQLWINSADRLFVYPNGVDRGQLHYLERSS